MTWKLWNTTATIARMAAGCGGFLQGRHIFPTFWRPWAVCITTAYCTANLVYTLHCTLYFGLDTHSTLYSVQYKNSTLYSAQRCTLYVDCSVLCSHCTYYIFLCNAHTLLPIGSLIQYPSLEKHWIFIEVILWYGWYFWKFDKALAFFCFFFFPLFFVLYFALSKKTKKKTQDMFKRPYERMKTNSQSGLSSQVL